MENKSATQAFLTILFSAILHTALLLIIIGIPVRQFFSTRDPEAIEYQKVEKRTLVEQPVRPAVTNDLADIPAPTPVKKKVSPKSVISKAKPVEKVEPKEEPAQEPTQAKTEEKQPKIIDVNFDKQEKESLSKIQDQTDKTEKPAEKTTQETPAAQAETKPEAKVETKSEPDPKAESEAVIEEDSAPAAEKTEKAEVKPEPLPKQAVEKTEKLKPVTDKVAGVQAAEDDAATEATSTDANPPAPDAEAPKADDGL